MVQGKESFQILAVFRVMLWPHHLGTDNRHVAPKHTKELRQQYFDNGEFVRHASHEVNSEENYNHIDGVNNNRKSQRPKWVDPKKRPSVRRRLQEKLNQVHGGKDKQRTREKT